MRDPKSKEEEKQRLGKGIVTDALSVYPRDRKVIQRMRIIAGEFRSRQLKSLSGDITRPTTDKVKEGVFNTIGPYFEGGRVLDLFAGSGNIALEAISRGMDEAVLADKNPKACEIIRENIDLLKLKKQTTVICGNYKSVLTRLADSEPFDLVYLDPPYALLVWSELFPLLPSGQLLAPNAIVIAETRKEVRLEEQYSGLIKTKETVYGITRVAYYREKEQTV